MPAATYFNGKENELDNDMERESELLALEKQNRGENVSTVVMDDDSISMCSEMTEDLSVSSENSLLGLKNKMEHDDNE